MNIKSIIHKYNMDSSPLYMTYEFSKEDTHNDNHTKIKNIYSYFPFSIVNIEFEYHGINYYKPTHLNNNKKYTNLHKSIYEDFTDNNYDAKFERELKNMPIEELIDLLEKYKCCKREENDKYTLTHNVEYDFKVTTEVKYNKLFEFKTYPLKDKNSRFTVKITFPEKEYINSFSIRMFGKYKGYSSLEIADGSTIPNRSWRKKINRNKGYKYRLKKYFEI
jgi:hypothetical protein